MPNQTLESVLIELNRFKAKNIEYEHELASRDDHGLPSPGEMVILFNTRAALETAENTILGLRKEIEEHKENNRRIYQVAAKAAASIILHELRDSESERDQARVERDQAQAELEEHGRVVGKTRSKSYDFFNTVTNTDGLAEGNTTTQAEIDRLRNLVKESNETRDELRAELEKTRDELRVELEKSQKTCDEWKAKYEALVAKEATKMQEIKMEQIIMEKQWKFEEEQQKLNE